MSGPLTDALIQLEGPALLWQSPPLNMPASGTGHDFGLHIGSNRGWVAPYARNVVSADGYGPGDTIQLIPHFLQPVGSPGGSVATRINPGRLTSRVAQGIYEAVRAGGAYSGLQGSPNYQMLYRGVFAAGPGPFPSRARSLAPAGPILCGETREFSLASGHAASEVPNSTGVEPFMWTLFGRCLVAEGGCEPGDVMAFGCFKASGTARGWSTAYAYSSGRFILAQYVDAPHVPGKLGVSFQPSSSNWAFFYRFIGTPKGLPGAAEPMPKQHRAKPVSLWMSPPIPLSAGLTPVSFACPDDFTPALVNSVYLCKTAEYGFSVGDWVPVQEGDNNTSSSGFSATLDRRNVTLAPQAFSAGQYTHRLDSSSFSRLTDQHWSWFYVFVG